MPGVLFPQGKYWADTRRFTLRALRDFGFGKSSMEDTILDEVDKFCDELSKFKSESINLNQKINISILNALWALMVGEKLMLNDPKLNEIVAMFDRFMRGENPTSALASMFPLPEMIRWPGIRHIMLPTFHSICNSLKAVTDIAEKYVKQHQSTLDQDNTRDFIDAFLVEMEKQKCDPSASFYGDRGYYTLINLLIDLFIAGMETTSTTLLWTYLLLLHHPEVKRKVHQEIDKVIIVHFILHLNHTMNQVDKKTINFNLIIKSYKCVKA